MFHHARGSRISTELGRASACGVLARSFLVHLVPAPTPSQRVPLHLPIILVEMPSQTRELVTALILPAMRVGLRPQSSHTIEGRRVRKGCQIRPQVRLRPRSNRHKCLSLLSTRRVIFHRVGRIVGFCSLSCKLVQCFCATWRSVLTYLFTQTSPLECFVFSATVSVRLSRIPRGFTDRCLLSIAVGTKPLAHRVGALYIDHVFVFFKTFL